VTKILIVDDDAPQARVLARAASVRRPDYTVITAGNGIEAIRILAEENVDLVLTDLQMPEMNGFELLAWIISHRPLVPVFIMTAYGNPETVERLNDMGAIECFTKPLDIRTALERISDSLSQRIDGTVSNVSLASFLQLIEMERKTCSLTVASGGKTGTLFVKKGRLVDACTGELRGEAAATAIIPWPNATISISSACHGCEHVIDSSLGFILMESMRLRDEETREAPEATEAAGRAAPRKSEFSIWPSEFPAAKPPSVAPGSAPGALRIPGGARAIAVVETATGELRTWGTHDGFPVRELAEMAAVVLRRQLELLESFGEIEGLEEVVLSTKERCDVIRPTRPGEFALLVFAPEETNLMIARLELERFIATHV
jgi:DNA-binding response OmpR family regulator